MSELQTDAAEAVDEKVVDTAQDDVTDAETASEGAAKEAGKAAEEAAAKDDPADKQEAKANFPDNWRELIAGENEDYQKLAKRYGSPRGVIKALDEAQKLIRSGKIKRDMPDPKDEAAMAEWRKDNGIPDDPTGYKLPDAVAKRMTDDDKPVLGQFTEFAHSKNAPPEFVEMAAEWYVENQEKALEAQQTADMQLEEAAEDALRKEWNHAEYKANMTLAKRYVSDIPGIGGDFSEFRGPDGRRLGDIPEFVMWASDQGRQTFGDSTFATADSESRHNSRRSEIERIRDADFDRYEREGLDKELRVLIEKDLKRGKR
jgi:hypothetical protein